MSGGAVTFEIADDWELTNRFGFTSGDADTLGLVPNGGAVQISALLADPTVDDAAVVIGVPTLENPTGISGSVTGRPISGEEYIQQFGAWEVRLRCSS